MPAQVSNARSPRESSSPEKFLKTEKPFIEAMRQATQLVRTRGPLAATRFIQGLLRPQRATSPGVTIDVDETAVIVEPVSRPDTATPARPWILHSASGQFVDQRYAGHSGARNYKLYIPSGDITEALPLVVMLHGCTQAPDDFAT